MPLLFTPSPAMTIGAEIELQLLDRDSLDLSPAAPKILERLGGERPNIKPEIFQAMLEINSGICRNVAQIRSDLESALAAVRAVCEPLKIELASAGSHPFARHRERLLFPADRGQYVIDRNRWVGRRLQIFGLHVHVGMRDGEHAFAMINAMLPYLAHLLALSASSPFWQGSDTGLASSRITIFEALPTAGTPCTFESWQSFARTYEAMVASGAVTTIKDIWWDIRPHPSYGTVEVRVCDGLPMLREAVALVALVQTLFDWFDAEHRAGRRFSPPAYWILRENKWRASRWGLDAKIVLSEDGRTSLLREEIAALLELLAPRAASLGCGEELAYLGEMLRGGVSYERQRKIFAQRESFVDVAQALVEELRGQAAPAVA
ncbi:MAG: glutamate--cysteine ligase [Myxococcales bacterium]|nr:glutamate--cysteine ligase [Myxococcales bacterium]